MTIREMKLRMKCYQAVAQFFEGDLDKIIHWFALPNPMLGNVRPIDMIDIGRTEKLWKFIKSAEADRKAPDAD